MITIDKLQQFGADTREGLGRCMNNEAFYLRLVNMGLTDKNFAGLEEAVRQGDRKAAFEAAHALKGVMANLALTPIYNPISEMTEALRGKTAMPDVGDAYARVQSALAEARKLLD
jgi:hypothetical protein